MGLRFGEFEIDFQLYELRCRGEVVRIDRRVFDLLRYLMEHHDRVVEKPELLQEVWGGDVVVDAVVPTAIARLRKVLGQSGTANSPIQTVHGRGYRFTATLAAATPPRPASDGRPQLLVDTDIHPGLRDPFVGRETHLARLQGALDKALAGTMRARLLVGEPGIGKTRLSQELAARARAAGARVWTGRCYEADTGDALWPWIQILRQGVDPASTEALKSLPEATRAELVALVPEWLDGPVQRAPVASSSGLARYDAVARFLRASAQRGPMVLVLDDLHWADTASLNLLGYLLEELAGTRILLLGTFRDAELPPAHPHVGLLDRLERATVWKRIPIEPLDRNDVGRYLHELTGNQPPPELVDGVHERTGGNPFFVRETVRSLTSDALRAGHLRLADIKLPDSARDVIRRRLSSLPEPTRNALHAASVLGVRFDLATLAPMLELDAGEVMAALDRGLAARVLVREETGVGCYAFAHALIRDTIYEDLPTTRSCELHFAAGRALEQQRARKATSQAEIALHLHRALPHGDGQRVFSHAKLAAEQAAAAGDHAQAAQLYSCAYDALGFSEQSDINRSAEVMLALGRAHRASGHPVAAREALDRVLELSAIAGAEQSWAEAARLELERLG